MDWLSQTGRPANHLSFSLDPTPSASLYSAPMPSRIAIYALTRRGIALGTALGRSLDADLHVPARFEQANTLPFDSLTAQVAETFTRYTAHIFIAAAGIAVRAIAPHLQGKEVDPAVIVLDQEGEHIISLLSGHLGGANKLTRQVASCIGGRAIITTATDTAGLPSLDMLALERGLIIGNLPAVKRVNAALLEGIPPQVYDPENLLGVGGDDRFVQVTETAAWNPFQPGVWVDWKTTAPQGDELRLHPSRLFAGIGCRRDTEAGEIEIHLREVFSRHGLALESLAGLATIEEKRDEAGITDTAQTLGVDIDYFNKDQLNGAQGTKPSALVRHHMGVDSVCEAAALLASQGGTLLVPKNKTPRVTCAVAVSLS